jgi:hypothetical protein
MSNNKNRSYLLRTVGICGAICFMIALFGNMLMNSPSVNAVDSDEFVCTEHEKGAKYDYTISYRGRSFLVAPKSGELYPIYDLANGEVIPTDDNDYSQVEKCIRMYNFHKDGIIGKSPAELRNGEMIINPNNPAREAVEMVKNSRNTPAE